MTEQESLQLIQQMINKAKNSYHEKGIGTMLWGSVITICSLVTFLRLEYDFRLLPLSLNCSFLQKKKKNVK